LHINPGRSKVPPVIQKRLHLLFTAVSALVLASGCNGQGGPSSDAQPEVAPSHIFTGVYVPIDVSNQITNLKTSLIVPQEPPATGTLFLWPGLDPRTGGTNYMPINNGVLQPVLTWGPSCAPSEQPAAYSTWWISGQYVNTNGNDSGYTGCQSGDIMPVNVGDTLNIEMSLSGTTWTQTITDVQTAQSVNFAIDMQGQAQNIAYFQIEGYSQNPVSDVEFTNTTITFAKSQPGCRVHYYGYPKQMLDRNDGITSPVISNGDLSCLIDRLVLHDPAGPVAAPVDTSLDTIGQVFPTLFEFEK
jgi:hypothetical protein